MEKISVEISTAQKELLDLFTETEIKEHYESLKLVHHLATYSINESMVDLPSSRDVHDILNVLEKIVLEYAVMKNPKT